MTDLKFILSNPPHPDPDPDAVARIFGLSAAEARNKLNFPGPEIWFASDDAADLGELANALADAGTRAIITSAADVVGLSNRLILRRFAFAKGHMSLELAGGQALEVPYDREVTVVVCRPMPREKIVRRTVRQAAKAANPEKSHRQRARVSLSEIKVPADDSFVDIYFRHDADVHRVTIRPGTVDFSALGEAKSVIERESAAALTRALRQRFARVNEDRRLERAPDPRIVVLGSRTLRGHLESIDPRLKDIDDYDLMSRVAFLTGRG